MYRIFFYTKSKQYEVHEMNYIPRVCEKICLFYQPWPKIKSIYHFPENYLQILGLDDEDLKKIDIVCLVD